jgi:hypothetical protein
MREHFKESRNNLWSMMADFWQTENRAERVKLSRIMEDAANAAYSYAFGSRNKINLLSVGVDVASLDALGFQSALKAMLKADEPRQKVSAVSFVEQLSRSLRDNLKNDKLLFKKHLFASELREFGYYLAND